MPRNNAPAPNISGDVYRLSAYSTTGGQVCINTWDYMGTAFASDPSAPMPALLVDLDTIWGAAFGPVTTPLTTLTQIQLACVSSNTPITLTTFPNLAGTETSTPMPNEVAVVLRKQGRIKGQHGRGRILMPGVPNSFTTPATNNNQINNAGRLKYLAFYSAVTVPITVAGISYVPVVSTRPVRPATLVTRAAVVFSGGPQLEFATARRRRTGIGI